jgi:hypothetical protein
LAAIFEECIRTGKETTEMSLPEDDTYKRIMDNAKDPKHNNHIPNSVNPDWYKSESQSAEERRQELEDWNAKSEEYKSKETPMERYCNKILRIVPEYYMTFEEHKKVTEDNYDRRMKACDELDEEYEFLYTKPDGMSDREWKEKKKLIRQERKQMEADEKLENNITSYWLLSKSLNVCFYKCNCTGEGLRNGIICVVCKLLARVNDYMVNLFKDAAEGRSSVI